MTRLYSGAWVLIAALAGCSSPQTSSSSNWVGCDTMADCSGLPEAVTCTEGLCTGAKGQHFTEAEVQVVRVEGGGGRVDASPGDSGPGCPGVDLNLDAFNCGACGKACTPAVIATVAGVSPTGIAIDATSVYWTNSSGDGTVMKVALSGGTPTTLASGQSFPEGIAIDRTSVYWTTVFGGTVMKVALSGGTPTTLVSGLTNPTLIAVDATNAYFQDGTGVMRVALSGGTPTTLVSGPVHAFAIDAENLYWTTHPAGTVVKDALLMKVALSGGTPVTLATGLGVAEMVIDATNAYFSDGFGTTVTKVPLAGGPPTTLASGQNRPSAMAVDATSFYWTTMNGNRSTVLKVALAGGTPVTLATGQGGPKAFAAVASGLYWTDIDVDVGGKVKRLGVCNLGVCE